MYLQFSFVCESNFVESSDDAVHCHLPEPPMSDWWYPKNIKTIIYTLTIFFVLCSTFIHRKNISQILICTKLLHLFCRQFLCVLLNDGFSISAIFVFVCTPPKLNMNQSSCVRYWKMIIYYQILFILLLYTFSDLFPLNSRAYEYEMRQYNVWRC